MFYASLRNQYGLDLSYVREYKGRNIFSRLLGAKCKICDFSSCEITSNVYIRAKVY